MATSTDRRPDPAHRAHDHARCVSEALDAAEALCIAQERRLTPLRRQVLELVWSSHRPRGAYEIMEALSVERGQVAPPTVYRALDFLLEAGLIHRIESLNAYIGCPSPERPHPTQFFICRACGEAAELHDARIGAAIDRGAAGLGFLVDTPTVEVRGMCARCREAESRA